MDIRLLAIVLALLGIVLGGFVSPVSLIYISAFLVGAVTVFLYRVSADDPGRSSAFMGLSMLVVGGLVCLLLPAWFVQLLK